MSKSYSPSIEERECQLLNKSYKPIGMVTLYKIKGLALFRTWEEKGEIYLQFYKEVDPHFINCGA